MPDIGDFKDVPIIEVHVKEGDAINAEDPLVTLESDKATMEVPAPSAGTVEKILVKVGDKVSEGTPILMFKGGEGAMTQPPSLVDQQEPPPQPQPVAVANTTRRRPSGGLGRPGAGATAGAAADFGNVHASPSVRRLARELERRSDQGQGHRREGPDHQGRRAGLPERADAPRRPSAAPSGGMGIPEIPAQDFSKFGPIETKPLPRIKKLSGPHLHRAWLNVPHVTHNDEADITEIDAYRKELDTRRQGEGLPGDAAGLPDEGGVSALREFPEFNSSLSPEKDSLILKKYYNIGIAVDTPEGLVVPVIKDVDRKGIHELSQELGARLEEGARRQAGLRPTCRAAASRSPAWAASAAPASRRSSTRPRWRSWAWCAPRWRRSGTARSSCRG